MRVRRQHHGALPIGSVQSRVLGPLEREIDQTIVDHADLQVTGQEPTLVIAELARVGDHRIEARLQE